MSDAILEERFRRWGYLQADLDPLGRLTPLNHPDLDAAAGPDADRLRAIYCGPIGVEFMHIPDPERTAWIAGAMEAPAADVDRLWILERLVRAEIFERFLHTRYVGTKRYSLEGVAALIPLLDTTLDASAGHGAEIALIGMSHRGRLAVMAHVGRVPVADLIAGFEDVDPRSVGGGDVKYHMGATGDYTTHSGRQVHVHIVSNPSHLEAVDPVLLGRVRARQERIGPEGRRKVLGLTLHGDAAFAGQGMAAESLNLANLHGYTVGGSIHVIVNNLVGFTTPPAALNSSRYASDLARRLPIPILHVNGFDPEAVVRAARLAADYRARFASDVLVDLIGFRRYGHSEVEDPTTTHPLLYAAIERLPMLWESYAERSGLVEQAKGLTDTVRAELETQLEAGRAAKARPRLAVLPAYWKPFRGGRYSPEMEVPTAVAGETLGEIARAVTTVPDGFTLHPKIKKLLEQRAEMGLAHRPVDWGMAEALAFGSLLAEGTAVRFSGQDSRRGTFNQRHSVWVDVRTGAEHDPLAQVAARRDTRFALYDSPLSEAAVMGFEYGFSRDTPEALVCWEAQFGDFVNGGQVIIDQFLAAGEDKWGLLSGLVLLLPHGYEGQGAEHSSARLERFLELAAEDNIQVGQPSTAGQYFHLLRRQARRAWRKPLIVMTPKGYLRAPSAASALEELSAGGWRSVLPDMEDVTDPVRLLVCSGKIAHELHDGRATRSDRRTAIVRLEQLYPFPEAELDAEIARYPSLTEIAWVQEEPANMGALRFVRPILARLAGERTFRTIKRSPSASPATGSAKAYAIEQKALLELAFARF